MEKLRERGYAVATELLPASAFYPAEAYHQDFAARNGQRRLPFPRTPLQENKQGKHPLPLPHQKKRPEHHGPFAFGCAIENG